MKTKRKVKLENFSTFSGGGTFFSATSMVAQELKKKTPKKTNPSCLNDFKRSLFKKILNSENLLMLEFCRSLL
jgi:hypothetical protein